MKALYAGSFDPPHLGHLDVIRRAARVCERLVVGVAANPDKKPFLPASVRMQLLRESCAGLANVEIASYDGATVLWARANGVQALVRGLRTAADLDNEAPMATVNRANGFETLFLLCDPALAHVSSRIIRQALAAGLSSDGMIPDGVLRAIRERTA